MRFEGAVLRDLAGSPCFRRYPRAQVGSHGEVYVAAGLEVDFLYYELYSDSYSKKLSVFPV